jgi:hypothetical protein
MAGMGPPPKPPDKRRRRTKPASYGAAEPTTAPAAGPQDRELGFDNPHQLIVDMWEALQISAESRFFSQADWERVRMELWYASQVMVKPSAVAWQQVQHGLTELLVSPAAKRRAAIQLKAATPDTDEVAAVSMMSTYRDKLKPV